MKTQHTPGPFEIGHVLGRTIQDELFYYEVYHYSGPIRSRIATAYGKDQQEAEANAKLIAAAPEMLKALQEISELKAISALSEHLHALIKCIKIAADEAIKKATE